MFVKALTVGVLLFGATGLMGCSNTVRFLTPVTWSNGPDGPVAAAAPPPVAPAVGADGQPVPAPAAPMAPVAGEPDRILYMTYWEGSCSGGFAGWGKGCSKGDTKVKRCNVKPDNTMVCAEEAEANKAFSTSN